MKKILFLVLFTAFSVSVFAQSDDKSSNKPSPWTLGITGFGYIPTSYTFFPELGNLIGYGGGVGAKFKGNVNRFIGFATELNYTYAANDNLLGLPGVNSRTNIVDVRESLVIQYETRRGENGFVPWFSIGAGLTYATFSPEVAGLKLTDYSGVGFNVNVGAGLRYNYKHFYTGISVDYTYALTYSSEYFSAETSNSTDSITESTNGLDPSGVRVGLELGFIY